MLDGLLLQLVLICVNHVMWDIPNLFQVNPHVTNVKLESIRIPQVRQSAIHVMLDGLLHQLVLICVNHVMWDIPNLFQVSLLVANVRRESIRIPQVRQSAIHVMLDGIPLQLVLIYVNHVMWDIPNLFQVSLHVTNVRLESIRIPQVRQSAIHVMLDGLLHQLVLICVNHVMWDIPNLFQVSLHVTNVRLENIRTPQVRQSAIHVMWDGFLHQLVLKIVNHVFQGPFLHQMDLQHVNHVQLLLGKPHPPLDLLGVILAFLIGIFGMIGIEIAIFVYQELIVHLLPLCKPLFSMRINGGLMIQVW